MILTPRTALLALCASCCTSFAGEPQLVRNINVLPSGGSSDQGSSPSGLVALGDRVYFAASDGVGGRELWSSDGTAGGTVLEADVITGLPDSDPLQPFVLGDSLIFFASESPGALQVLWRYVPASRTLEKLADAHPAGFAEVGSVTANGAAYFSALDGVWRTDGTASGTRGLGDIAPAVAGVKATRYAEVGGRVYFSSPQFSPPQPGFALWITDGTETGTQRLVLFAPTFTPTFLTKLGDRLYHMAALVGSPPILWRTDPAVSFAVTAFDEFHEFLGVVNERLLFVAFASPSEPQQLWVFDAGSSSFTKIPGSNVVFPGPVSENGALVFYTGSDTTHGVGPWVTDGTEAGTRALIDVPVNTQVIPHWLGDFHDVAIFTVAPSPQDPVRRFWRSDGTVAGTVAIGELDAARSIAANTPIAVTAGNHFYFSVTDPVIGAELYAIENEVPVAAGDSSSTNAGQAVTVNVLANDSDTDGTIDTSSVTIVNAPQHGMAMVTGSGAISYTPAAGYSGPDNFTYSVRDRQGRSSAPGTVSMTVAAPPPPPGGGNSSAGGGGGGALGWLTLLLLTTYGCVARNSRIRR